MGKGPLAVNTSAETGPSAGRISERLITYILLYYERYVFNHNTRIITSAMQPR